MSGLRQVPKKVTVPDEDIEALIAMDSPTKTATAFAAASASDSFSSPSDSCHNPLFLARVIFRKVVAYMTEEEDQAGILSLLREIILGIFLGVVFISAIVFLDHRDILHLESAHNFRNSAFRLLSDPETLATIEESTGLVFMPMDKYESHRKDIESAASKKAENVKKLQEKTDELEKMKKEVDAIRGEHTTLMNNPLLELDKFCPSCQWAKKTTCFARAQYLQDKYNTRPVEAKINAMEVPTCKKQS